MIMGIWFVVSLVVFSATHDILAVVLSALGLIACVSLMVPGPRCPGCPKRTTYVKRVLRADGRKHSGYYCFNCRQSSTEFEGRLWLDP